MCYGISMSYKIFNVIEALKEAITEIEQASAKAGKAGKRHHERNLAEVARDLQSFHLRSIESGIEYITQPNFKPYFPKDEENPSCGNCKCKCLNAVVGKTGCCDDWRGI